MKTQKEMSDNKEMIVLTFEREADANEIFNYLQKNETDGLIEIIDAVILSRDADGEIHTREIAAEQGQRWSRRAGALGGALLGLLGGLPGVVVGAVAGAAIGNTAAGYVDFGMTQDEAIDIADALKPNTSAFVVIIKHMWVEKLADRAARFDAAVMRQKIKADIAEQLEQAST